MNVWLAEIWRAWRASLRRPGFLLLASGVLALGVGSTVAVFSLIDDVLMRPLPYAQPQRLVALGSDGGDGQSISPRGYQHLSGLSGVASMGLVEGVSPPVNVAGGGAPERVGGMRVDRGLLPTLGVQLQVGRNFSAEEDRPHGPAVAILGYGFWQRRYAANPEVIGDRILIEGVPHTIIGVLPPRFNLQQGCDLMLPLALPAHSREDGPNYRAIARLSPGATVGGVSAQVQARLHALAASDGDTYAQHLRFTAGSLRSALRSDRVLLLPLFVACALFVLLIALVNLTNLMLMRALSRRHEAAVRHALGAPRARLALPALADGLLVGLGGAVAGLALAALGLALFQHVVPSEWLQGNRLDVDGSGWLLALGMGLFGALVPALLGLWRSGATGAGELRQGGRNGTSRQGGRLGRVLVVAQMALAAALLCLAAVFLHGLYAAARAPLGFSARGVLAFELAPVRADYPDAAAVQALSRRVLDRLRTVPGVDSAAAATNLPIGRWFNFGGFHIGDGDSFSTEVRGVEPGFFATFGIAVRAGRPFQRTDVRGGEAVIMVSESFARKYFGGHALGQVVDVPADHDRRVPARVIGVVADTHQFSALQPAPPILYMPLAQMPDWAMRMFRGWFPLRFALRVRGAPNDYRAAAHAAVTDVAPTQPIGHLRPLQQDVDESTSDVRLDLLLIGTFALLAVLLAAAGMYSVMAMAVSAREQEFGVRMALGASSSRLLRLVLGGGLAQAAVGLACGLGLALLLSGSLGALLQVLGGENTIDPLAMVMVCRGTRRSRPVGMPAACPACRPGGTDARAAGRMMRAVIDGQAAHTPCGAAPKGVCP